MSLLHWMADVTRLAHGTPICGPRRHDRIKATSAEFDAATVHLGHQDDGGGGLMRLANCRACGSTLVAPECHYCLRELCICNVSHDVLTGEVIR